MGSIFFKNVKNAIKHWYLPLIAGLALIGGGIWVLSDPGYSYVWCAYIFSLSFIVVGAIDTVFALVNKNTIDNWGWKLVFGLLTLAIGIVLNNDAEISLITLPFYVAIVILLRSLRAIVISLDLKRLGLSDWSNLMIIGVLGTITGLILLFHPVLAGLTVVMWAGTGLIIVGLFSVYFSIKLKKLHNLGKELSNE